MHNKKGETVLHIKSTYSQVETVLHNTEGETVLHYKEGETVLHYKEGET